MWGVHVRDRARCVAQFWRSTTRSGDLRCSDKAGKQTAGSRDLLQSKCELAPMMPETFDGVQQKKLIRANGFFETTCGLAHAFPIHKKRVPCPSLRGPARCKRRASILFAWTSTPTGRFPTDALIRRSTIVRYIRPQVVAIHLPLREHTCLPFIQNSHKEASTRWRLGRSPQELKPENKTAARFNLPKASLA